MNVFKRFGACVRHLRTRFFHIRFRFAEIFRHCCRTRSPSDSSTVIPVESSSASARATRAVESLFSRMAMIWPRCYAVAFFTRISRILPFISSGS